MKKRAVLFSIVFLSCAPLYAADPMAAGAAKNKSVLERMLERGAPPKSKAAREGGVQKRVTQRKPQRVGGYSAMTQEEFQAFFREEELPPSQALVDMGAKLYAMLQRPAETYDKSKASRLFQEFKDMGGTMTFRVEGVASCRLNELRRDRLRVMRRR
jgi:hypothetical protein